MADLTPKQLDLLKERAKILDEKPCPVCGCICERVIYTEQFQLMSYNASEDIDLSKSYPYITVGIIKCPKCDYITPFVLPYEENN